MFDPAARDVFLSKRRIMATATFAFGQLPLMEDAGSAGPPRVVQSLPAPTSAAEATFELVQKVRAGDAVAADVLFTRYEARLRRWAHGRLPAQSRGALETQDLVQETLIKVFQRLPAFHRLRSQLAFQRERHSPV